MNWRLGVVGSPIEHSLSPQLHAAGLALAGLTGVSARYEVAGDDLEGVRSLLGATVDALSVTMPLKRIVASLCDELTPAAASLGIVNSLLVRDSRVWGNSTDGQGFLGAVQSEFATTVENMHVVVLGAGGSAAAIVDALVEAKVNSIAVHGRTPAHVDALVARHPNVVDHMIIYRPVDLIVNTVPVSGRVESAAVMQGVSRDTLAMDITYEPRESSWLALHRANGCATANGLAMLAHQAAAQMNWWWGTDFTGADLRGAIE